MQSRPLTYLRMFMVLSWKTRPYFTSGLAQPDMLEWPPCKDAPVNTHTRSSAALVGTHVARRAAQLERLLLKKVQPFSKGGPHAQGFLICRVQPCSMMNAAEQLEIRCHNPPANTTGNTKLRSATAAKVLQRAHVREGTFEGAFAASQFDKRAQQWTGHLPSIAACMNSDVIQAQQLNFKAACSFTLQLRVARANKCGPINIYSPSHWRLALLYLSTPGSVFC